MKTKLILIVAAICMSAVTFAQVGRPAFGLRAGVNFQNLNGKDENDDNLENDLKTGFHVGVTGDIPFAQDFYIQPGLLYSTKGAKIEGSDVKVNIGYLEIPINLLYKPLLGEGRLLMGFGPYVAFGLNGKVKGDDAEYDIEFDKETSVTDPDFTIKRFDAGANLLFGYEFTQRLSAQLNAQLGLLNMAPEYADAPNLDPGTIKNTGFGVSLGYKF
jgi:hypothetical protein